MHPERWSKETRDWSIIDKVWLNPEKADKSINSENIIIIYTICDN